MASNPSSSLAGLVLLASRIVCLIVIASFVVFVVDRTGSASTHQQNALTGNTSQPSESSSSTTAKESSLHRTLDEASNALTSPFAGVVSGTDSEWVIRLVRTALALLVYGLGVAFLVRIIRIRT
ncbi:MAG TPA: hypothetical protein VMG80_00900 [Solirubrobacteraceae bacterium]|nr:hypothetical protein [Solirubrobacteraceae bacterium]